MASAQVCATVPNFLVLEFHWFNRDYWKQDPHAVAKTGLAKTKAVAQS